MPLPELPVIAGYHPDPSICRAGDAYYLACSSFEYAPGVPVFRSEDLVTWAVVGHALDRPDQLSFGDDAAPSGGIYAPTLRHHDGRFWLVTTNVSDGGHLLVTAADPAGPWSDPVRIRLAGGIDPDITWDDAGTCYLTWSDGAIRQAVLDPVSGTLLGVPVTLWSGTGGKDVEAPHLYQVDGAWYLLVAEGGTGPGHAVTVARGPSPQGPWEENPRNPVLTARGTASPVQNTGHADLVQRPDGTWAAVFLGVRPAGYFPSWHVLGRETFAAELLWEDGWPVLGAPIQPRVAPSGRTVLEAPLAHDWVAAGRFPDEVLRPAGEGWTLTAPEPRTFVGRRQEHLRFTARARIEAADGAGGLEVRIDPLHALTLEVDGPMVRAVARIGGIVTVLGEAALAQAAPAGELVLESVDSPHPHHSHRRGPDELVASVATSDGLVELGRLDGRYLSTEVAGGFTGRMVGLVAERGVASVRSFEYVGT